MENIFYYFLFVLRHLNKNGHITKTRNKFDKITKTNFQFYVTGPGEIDEALN